jgi:hypothetical protein
MGRAVTLVTTDGELADAARREPFAVVLIGAEPGPVQYGVNAPDWAAAYDWLIEQPS